MSRVSQQLRTNRSRWASPVPMYPILAAILNRLREETPYAADNEWVFPSFKLRGKQPRTATTLVSDYIRGAEHPAPRKPVDDDALCAHGCIENRGALTLTTD